MFLGKSLQPVTLCLVKSRNYISAKLIMKFTVPVFNSCKLLPSILLGCMGILALCRADKLNLFDR